MAFDPISSIADAATKILGKFFPDADEKMKLKFQQATLEIQNEAANALAQLEVNKVEAASPHWFVASWRPFCGWICGLGLLYSFVGQPFLSWASMVFKIPTPPALDADVLMVVLSSMLGMASIRSYDKSKGTDTKSIR